MSNTLYRKNRDYGIIIAKYNVEGKREIQNGSGVLDHQPAPPNDSGFPLRRSHKLFEDVMIVIVDRKKSISNPELAMIVLGVIIFLSVLLVPVS